MCVFYNLNLDMLDKEKSWYFIPKIEIILTQRTYNVVWYLLSHNTLFSLLVTCPWW